MTKQEQQRCGMTLRLPAELKKKLENIAKTNKRSLTREIESALEAYAKAQTVDNADTKVVS